MRFYMASESDITSIAVAYYLLISILPLLLIAANILPYFKIRPTQIFINPARSLAGFYVSNRPTSDF